LRVVFALYPCFSLLISRYVGRSSLVLGLALVASDASHEENGHDKG
jgi:hypothetical protein